MFVDRFEYCISYLRAAKYTMAYFIYVNEFKWIQRKKVPMCLRCLSSSSGFTFLNYAFIWFYTKSTANFIFRIINAMICSRQPRQTDRTGEWERKWIHRFLIWFTYEFAWLNAQCSVRKRHCERLHCCSSTAYNSISEPSPLIGNHLMIIWMEPLPFNLN